MGMNIYTLDGKHIGKRFAAGVWCWDCKTEVKHDDIGCFFFCPRCGQKHSIGTLNYNPAYRELGFSKPEPRKHTGIDGASGFTWCTDKETGLAQTTNEIKSKIKRRKFLIDENDGRMTIKEFFKMFDDIIKEECSDYNFS